MPIRLAIALGCAIAFAAPAAAAAPLPATVKLLDCSPEGHSASFHGRMKQIEGAERMWMRFRLFERRGSAFVAVDAPGLDRWHRSREGVGTFGWRQNLLGLQAGASYRARASFRWYDADGALLARARRRSPVCRQFAELPNLVATLSAVHRTKVRGVWRYVVRVDNDGVAAAEDVPVRLQVDGGTIDTAIVAAIEPAESRLVTFRGPACEDSVTVAADPDDVLTESEESDNTEELAYDELPPPS